MKSGIKTLAMWLIIGIIFVVLLTSIVDSDNNKLAYSELIESIEAGEVSEIEISADGMTAEVKLKNESLPPLSKGGDAKRRRVPAYFNE